VDQPAAAAVPAQPAQDSPAVAELAPVIAQLATAVQDLNAGKGDREKVVALTEELEATREQLRLAQEPRTGFVPPEEAAQIIAGRKRLGVAELHAIPAWEGAKLTGVDKDSITHFHNVSDELLILSAALKCKPQDTKFYESAFLPAIGAMAMDSTTSAEGDEFVPTLLSGNLIERVELALMVVALFPSLDMPSNPFEIPGFGTRTRGGKAVEQTADTGQTGFLKITPATRKITLTAVKFAAEALVSKELEEDSIVPILPFIREELVSQMAHDMEDAVINGDTTGTHQDSDVTAATDPRKNWDGLRKLANAGAKTDGGNAVLTAAMLRTNRKKMGKYGVNPNDVVHVIGIGQYVNLLSDANVLTVDKFGPNATILTGELGKVDGIAIVVSEYVRADLNATGVYDNTTTNRSIAITTNRRGFLVGNRRTVTVQLLTELYAEYDQDAITVSHRKAFVKRYASADNVHAVTYNLAA
jgi:HK97 family phage major capsid protein